MLKYTHHIFSRLLIIVVILLTLPQLNVDLATPVVASPAWLIVFIWGGALVGFSAVTVLTQRVRGWYQRRDRAGLSPQLSVAMLGSRGVPANYSGVEKYAEEVGAFLVKRNVAVTVYCHAKYVSQRGDHRGMSLVFMPTIKTKHLETIVHTFLSTCHALWQGTECFHYLAIGPATVAWLPRLFGRKVVTTVQGLDWDRAKWGQVARWYLKLGEWATITFSHQVVVVSKTLHRHFQQKYQRYTCHIPNGYQPPIQREASLIKNIGLEADRYFLFVGRLSPEKGCHTLIEAFKRLNTAHHLVLAGKPNFAQSYHRTLQNAAQGSPHIHFAGFVQGALLQELYTNAYVVVLPSEREGLSVSLLEALSYHNCLLVSDIPENVEVLPAGYTFQVGNVTDLSKQLQRLVDYPEQVVAARKQLAHSTTQLATWPQVGAATHEIYNAVRKQALVRVM